MNKRSPEDFTIKEISDFQQYLQQNAATIRAWKIEVKKFADANGLSDRAAIDLARAKLPLIREKAED